MVQATLETIKYPNRFKLNTSLNIKNKFKQLSIRTTILRRYNLCPSSFKNQFVNSILGLRMSTWKWVNTYSFFFFFLRNSYNMLLTSQFELFPSKPSNTLYIERCRCQFSYHKILNLSMGGASSWSKLSAPIKYWYFLSFRLYKCKPTRLVTSISTKGSLCVSLFLFEIASFQGCSLLKISS